MLPQITAFVMKHAMLCSAFLIVFILLIMEEARSQRAKGEQVSAAIATHFINREEAVVIDLRDAIAFRAGHIVNAKNIALADFDSHLEKLSSLRERRIILVDASGLKTTAIFSKLKQAGFEKVVSLKGGMNAWKMANMPIVKK